MQDWTPNLATSDKPHYLAIADAIAEDIRSGRPCRLRSPAAPSASWRAASTSISPPWRAAIWKRRKRGLIESHVGRGTFVRSSARRRHSAMLRHPEIVDLSMNLPPEPDDPELLDRMQDGFEAVGRDLVSLLRYQGFGGVQADKDAASNWLSRRALVPPQDRLFIAPGAHPALLGIFGLLAKPGDVILSEHLTYPGTRSIAAQLGLKLVGLPMDDDGIDAAAFAQACKRLNPKALYVNPTLLNPPRIRSPSRGGSRSPKSRAAMACPSWRMTPMASCRPAARRPSRRWRRSSPGTWPDWPSVSAPGCEPPTWWRRTCAPAGCSPRRCVPRPLWPRPSPSHWRRDGSPTAPATPCSRPYGGKSIERQRLAAAILPGSGIRTDPGRLPFVGGVAGALDPLRLRWPHALDRHRRRRQRRVRHRRLASRSGAGLPRRPARPHRHPQRTRIHGARARGVAGDGVDLLVTAAAEPGPRELRCHPAPPDRGTQAPAAVIITMQVRLSCDTLWPTIWGLVDDNAVVETLVKKIYLATKNAEIDHNGWDGRSD